MTGTGLAASAGLNAYIPLLTMGALARYTELVDLPAGWSWLSNGWVLTILAVLLAVEVVADKVPVVDHVNDVVQTFVRPTAGGLAFGAGSSAETVTVSDPGAFFTTHQWVPIAAGVVIALFVHGVKAAARPVVNVSTAGAGAPVASTAEDLGSVTMSLLALLVPVLVLVGLALLGWATVQVVRRRRRRRRERAQLSGSGSRHLSV
ncbi:membrane protein [Paractinoplanes rishiriensis]|uniref:Membrane protein n=1 Tax=Paractinoplanes rishiriensis TaxID=1050105 RepID=A0A919MZH8_9ACTN|nr:membrane protein [Actinoplanes rishiriensis]